MSDLERPVEDADYEAAVERREDELPWFKVSFWILGAGGRMIPSWNKIRARSAEEARTRVLRANRLAMTHEVKVVQED